jgi:hypothetical protein
MTVGKASDIFIIVLCGLFICQEAKAQNSVQKIDWNKTAAIHISNASVVSFQNSLQHQARPFFPSITQDINLMGQPTFSIAKDLSVKHLAFFCRQELMVEKSIKVPLRFRVGSLAQCNALEGK